MLKSALLIAAGAAALIASPADARHHYRHHYRHYYYSYYSPYRYYPAYSYAYPSYSYAYPAYSYGYPAYYGYPSYYSYPTYPSSSFGISIGIGGGRYRHYRRW